MKLINDDCLRVLPTLADKSVDLVITSPPYNIGMNYNKYQDKRNDYVNWLVKIFNECCRVLKDDGHLFLNISSGKDYPFTSYKVAENIDWKLQNNIIWAKAVEIDNQVRGYTTPHQSNRYLINGWEHLFHFTKDGNTKIDVEWSSVPFNKDYNNYERQVKRTGKNWRKTTHCWHFTYKSKATKEITKQIVGEKKHPAIFPEKLVEKCVKVSGLKKGVILDPFLGTGTTGLVALKYSLDFIGMEIDLDYFNFARERLNNGSI